MISVNTILAGIGFLGTYQLYKYGTMNKKIVTIKYKDHAKNMITTINNDKYNVITTLSRMHYYPIMYTFEENETIEIKYFGLNIPKFDIYPKVYEIYNARWEDELKKWHSKTPEEKHKEFAEKMKKMK
jgi:hypothetical protein